MRSYIERERFVVHWAERVDSCLRLILNLIQTGAIEDEKIILFVSTMKEDIDEKRNEIYINWVTLTLHEYRVVQFHIQDRGQLPLEIVS